MALKIASFLALVLTALALAPGGAHFFALPNKIHLAQQSYFIVQGIYRGWALLGVVLIGALFANFVLMILSRGRGAPFWFALASFVLVGATLAIFFTWTYPANQATSNWTVAPDNWAALRVQWEYSHALNAALTFVALCAVTLSVLTRERT
ncbi:MAG: DUF1772 domain-containing protein [Alphaproteobacteria bacterium]|nr:DUF1772 domain-containing protein [Alphaproteobacteria bacterium]